MASCTLGAVHIVCHPEMGVQTKVVILGNRSIWPWEKVRQWVLTGSIKIYLCRYAYIWWVVTVFALKYSQLVSVQF